MSQPSEQDIEGRSPPGSGRERPLLFLERLFCHDNSARSALASCRSGVSNPSLNQP